MFVCATVLDPSIWIQICFFILDAWYERVFEAIPGYQQTQVRSKFEFSAQ